MGNDLLGLFPLDPGIAYLNHASYGAPLRRLLAAANSTREATERDTALRLGRGLVAALHRVAGSIQQRLATQGGQLAVVPNATAANNALAASLELGPGRSVALFDSEYSSVIRCWQAHAARRGAALRVLPLELPATRAQILDALDSLDDAVGAFVASAVSSTAAVAMPLAEISGICQERGIRLVVDAAHMLGHMDQALAGCAPSAVFGSLHKWLPSPRPAGFLWVADGLADQVKPAAVSLTWDEPGFLERFSWWGTWDPAACLTVPEGFEALDLWRQEGRVTQAEDLAEAMSRSLAEAGLKPTTEPALAAKRLRAFLAPRLSPDLLRSAVDAAGVRAWVGQEPRGATVLRLSTNVYNDQRDSARLVATVAQALGEAA
ncbi:MAG: aminotransferase class V-fold PLP-dependent enzyme [Bifidobacteriaceae bacterium]|nr:aminotransferase class V-fold PLP-dependent enzyme [Bifidobacteriaceae bacterium]